jgi:tetratricopeptide (TPR) repeat protein
MRSFFRRDALRWPGILLSGLLAACASFGVGPRIPLLPEQIPAYVELEETPFFPQDSYHCGPAALATLLQHRKIPATPESLAKLTYLRELKGSLQVELVATARRLGVLVYPLQGGLPDLLQEVAAGNPVLILQNQAFAWYPRWHYAVVVGYDLQRGLLILRSGRERRWITDFKTFMNTWRRAGDWAVVTLAPGSLPATASTPHYLRAANDLEQIGDYRAARLAYQTAVEAWPDNATAWLALGNSAYRDADWAEAAAAFRQAAELAPDDTAAWNNLAYALAANGRRTQALAALEKALSLAPEDPNLLDSRREILELLQKE